MRFLFVKKTSIPDPSKVLDISSATAWVAPDLLRTLAILSDAIVRRSAVDRDDLKPYWKLNKRPYFSRWSRSLLFTSFSKTLLTTERRLTEWWFATMHLSPVFLNTRTTDENFQESGKKIPWDIYSRVIYESIYETSICETLVLMKL